MDTYSLKVLFTVFSHRERGIGPGSSTAKSSEQKLDRKALHISKIYFLSLLRSIGFSTVSFLQLINPNFTIDNVSQAGSYLPIGPENNAGRILFPSIY